jgi:hypothetical protein
MISKLTLSFLLGISISGSQQAVNPVAHWPREGPPTR